MVEKTTRRVALTMTGLAASFACVVFLLRPRLTFAQVQSKVLATRSVRYEVKKHGDHETEDIQYAKNIIDEARHHEQNFDELFGSKPREEQGRIRERISNSLQEAQDYLRQRDDNPPYDRVFVLGRYLQRQERRGVHGDVVDILDMTTGKHIHLNHKDRTATVFTSQTTISANTGEKETAKIVEEPNREVDFYSNIRKIPGDAIQLTGTRSLDNKECIGFRVSSIDGPYTRTRTFWIDKETKLPKQIDIQLRPDDQFYAPVDVSMVNIEFDIVLDESLFRTEVPPGYKLRKSGLMDISN